MALLARSTIAASGRSDIGTALKGPNIDYASIAKGYGLYAEGPDHRSKGSRARDQARDRAGEEGRTRAAGCGDAAAMSRKALMRQSSVAYSRCRDCRLRADESRRRRQRQAPVRAERLLSVSRPCPAKAALAGARLAQTKLPQIAFTAYVRNPPSGGMPPFRAKVMSDQDLADVYAYIKTFPEPSAAKDIPLLNQ